MTYYKVEACCTIQHNA